MRYLVWDFDGTLAHRPGMWSQCLADLANAAIPDINVTREQLRPHLSSGFPWHRADIEHPHLSDADAWWANLFPVLASALALGSNVEPERAANIAIGIRTAYIDPSYWVVFPDTEPALAALSKRGWRHIVLSNHVPELPTLIANLGLDHYFEHILTSASIGLEKPHPLAFEAALAKIPQGNRQIIMIGDSFTADYRGAQAAGLNSILVRGSHPECDTAFPDLHALVDYLKDISQ